MNQKGTFRILVFRYVMLRMGLTAIGFSKEHLVYETSDPFSFLIFIVSLICWKFNNFRLINVYFAILLLG
jgi:hypothetical protein